MVEFEQELETLKRILVTNKNFKEIYEYFLDHLGENPDFQRHGKKTKHPFLKKILTTVGRQIFHDETQVTKLVLIKIPQYPFYHGVCLLGGTMCSLMFFQDIEVGLLSLLMPMFETRFVRFSATRIESEGEVFFYPSASDAIH